jgi:DNA-binding response OmpR family regulator
MKTALILEDSRLEATLILIGLRALGYRVEWQRGMKGAKAACHGHTFGLYIVDVHVQADDHGGTASGLDFLRWLQPCSGRVIVCSGDRTHEAEAERLGARFVLKSMNLVKDIERSLA